MRGGESKAIVLEYMIKNVKKGFGGDYGVQPVHSEGDQPWVFIGGTDVETESPILWPPDVKS